MLFRSLFAVPWLVPLLSGVSAAAGLGTTAYSLANQPSTPKAPTSTGPTPAQQASALKAQQQAAVLAQQGNTQAQTGGSLTPESFLTTSAKNAGAPSDLNSIMQYLGGGGSSSNAPISGGTTTPNSNQPQDNNLQSLSDLLKAA